MLHQAAPIVDERAESKVSITMPAVTQIPPAYALPTARSLTTRPLDVWLLGGISIVVWAVMFVFQHFRSSWAVDHYFRELGTTAIVLALTINNPHFLASYKLAYTRGWFFVREHWWQLIVVPLLLILLFAAAFYKFDSATAAVLPFVPRLVQILASWDLGTKALAAPRLGDFLFTLAFNVMFLTVGWHYVKQTFGCVMVYAAFDSYPLSPRERRLIKWNLLSLWWLNFSDGSKNESKLVFSDFTYYGLGLPHWLYVSASVVVTIGVALVIYQVAYRRYATTRRLPSLNMIVPYVAIYLWWTPFTRQTEFYMLLTPLFHSLQYLPFVYKIEASITRAASGVYRDLRGPVVICALIIAAWMSFELLPNVADNRLQTFATWHMFFFFTAAMLFINIHHYFIDSVLWRLRDPVVRNSLLA